MKITSNKVKIHEKIGYGAIEVGNQFSWTMISTYLSVFYTDVVGLAPMIVSIILLIARVWDGINDPMMGVIASRTKTRFGKYRPYLIFGAPVVAIFSILSFTKTGLTGGGAVAYAAVTYILCGMAYTAVCIPQGSLANVMTRDLNQRVSLNAFRQIGSSVTGLIISAVAMPLILYFGNGSTSSSKGYLFTTIIFGVLGMLCVMYGGIVCKERVTTVQEKTPGIKESFLYTIKNKDVLLSVVMGLFMAGAILGRMGALSYWFIYYVGNAELMAPVMVCYNIAGILVQFAVPMLVQHVGKKKSCILSYILMSFGMLMLFFFGRSSTTVIYVGSIIIGLSNFSQPILFSIVGDIADAEEVKHGYRSDGIVYAMMSLGTKIGIAIGGSLSVFLLGAVGYVANAEQSEATLMGMNAVTNIVPIVFLAIAALGVGLLSINDKKAEQNKAILEERANKKKEAMN